MNNINTLKLVVASVATFVTFLFGEWDMPLVALLVFVVLDYVLGLTRAFINKEVSSTVGLKGITKKAVIFAVLIVAVITDRLLNFDGWVCRTATCWFYIANEGISVLENCASLGVKIPDILLDTLAQLKQGEKKEYKNGDGK